MRVRAALWAGICYGTCTHCPGTVLEVAGSQSTPPEWVRTCAHTTKSFEVGKDLWRSSHPTTWSKQGHLHTAVCHVQVGFEYLQGWRQLLWTTCASAQSSSQWKVQLQPCFHQPQSKGHLAQVSCLLQQKADTPWQGRCDSFCLCCAYFTKRLKTSSAKASNRTSRTSSK